MTHSVNGNIVAIGKFPHYDQRQANQVVIDFMRRTEVEYVAKYDDFQQLTAYSYCGMPPFIDVQDRPTELGEGRPSSLDLTSSPLEGKLLLLICVGKGSHAIRNMNVGAGQIYSTTMRLNRLIRRGLANPDKVDTAVLFDDKHKLYLPHQFRKLITPDKVVSLGWDD